jgi:hypothetical protein
VSSSPSDCGRYKIREDQSGGEIREDQSGGEIREDQSGGEIRKQIIRELNRAGNRRNQYSQGLTAKTLHRE